MQNIVIFYGGKSVEHDISVLTAISVMNNLNKNRYKIFPVYLTRENKFIMPANYQKIDIYTQKITKFKPIFFNFGENYIKIGKYKKVKVDCAINCCHGFFGEDGTISALCNLCDIPLTSTDILGASTCMDKVIMKDIFVANQIPCVDYMLATKEEYNNKTLVQKIKQKFNYPVIVKPSNLGSSIGITKASDDVTLCDALEIAFCYDSRVIVEKCLENFKEVNIACLGNGDCELSAMEEPLGWQDFLNFDDKYTNTDITKKKIVNPKLPSVVKQKIQDIATRAFCAFDLSGVVRMDFMVSGEDVFLNEINTVPGSLAFYLWKKQYDFFELLDKLIELAIDKHKKKNMNKYTYSSGVLSHYKSNILNKYSK